MTTGVLVLRGVITIMHNYPLNDLGLKWIQRIKVLSNNPIGEKKAYILYM